WHDAGEQQSYEKLDQRNSIHHRYDDSVWANLSVGRYGPGSSHFSGQGERSIDQAGGWNNRWLENHRSDVYRPGLLSFATQRRGRDRLRRRRFFGIESRPDKSEANRESES